jgi:hypothetical protein
VGRARKVFRQPARLAGANPQHGGPFVPHRLHPASVAEWIPRLAAALLRATGHESADLCPWSSGEGLLHALARGLGHRFPARSDRDQAPNRTDPARSSPQP